MEVSMNMQTTTKPRADEAEFDPEQVRAELRRAGELAASSPASQAACDIMRLVRRQSPAIKAMLHTRFEAGGAKNDGSDWWSASWGCNGQSFSLSLLMYGPFTSQHADDTTDVQIHGDGFLSLEVDSKLAMSLRVELRCDDPEERIAVVGAMEFEPGPWTHVVLELARRMADAGTPHTYQKAA
jgi:hypothetical protein